VLKALVAGVLALAVPVLAHAQTPAPAADQEPPAEPQPRGFRVVWNDKPSLRAGSVLRVDLIGKFQWDARQAGDDPPDSFESTEIQRARVGIDGEFLRNFDFNIEYELTERELDGNTSATAWKDVYLDVDFANAARVRLGKFKVPFGLDQLTSVANLDFIYRSLGSSNLAPARDTGVMIYGELSGGRFDYAVGAFRHDGENARSRRIAGADETGAARFRVAPFQRQGASLLDQLELGAGVTMSALANPTELPNGLRGRTVMSKYEFFEPLFVNGRRQRYEIDAEWRWRRVGARAEYMNVRDTRDGQGFLDNDLPPARARSWFVSGAYVITGERKNWPVTPRGEVGRGGFGAVEVVGRYERLKFDGPAGADEAFRHPRAETILPSGDRAMTWGINWYVNRFVKVQAHAIREQLDDPERHPRPDGKAFWNAAFRLQCAM
jgi:phosphate-selective porin OprO/OprP